MGSTVINRRQATGLACFAGGVLFVAISFGILASHVKFFGLKRDTAVAIGTALPELKSTVNLLAANVEAEQLFTRDALAAREEQASAYMLPEGSPTPRTLDAIAAIAEVISTDPEKAVRIERTTFEPKATDHGSYKTLEGHIVLQGSFQAVSRFLGILAYSGDMMMRDVMPLGAQAKFLQQVEASTPLSLKPAEDFLYIDLLQYASDPDTFEQHFLKDMPLDAAADIKSFVLQSGAADIRRSFDHIAAPLRNKKVWPLPLISVTGMHRDGGTWTVDCTVFSR